MRFIAVVLAASTFGTGCLSNGFKISGTEVQRLASLPPEARGQHVRVAQELGDSDAPPAQPVTGETQIIFVPNIYIDATGDRRRGYYNGGGISGGGGSYGGSGPHPAPGGHVKGGGGGGGFHGGGGDGKGEAIAILVAAAVILVAAAAVEGSRFDGYAQLHPMHPVHLYGKDGSYAVLPLAWIDPATAAFTDHAIVRSSEGPWNELERAPLSREGWTYSMYGGLGTYKSADGSVDNGAATTIQLGYFPDQKVGIVGSIFFGWRDNSVQQTLFESRYTAEVQGYPVQAGPLHLGLYGGGGAAYRFEDGIPGGNAGSLALIGGAMLQLDINTRIALTARLGQTYAHDERMSDAMVGLSVY